MTDLFLGLDVGTLHFSRANTTDRRRRAYANEFQSPPIPRTE